MCGLGKINQSWFHHLQNEDSFNKCLHVYALLEVENTAVKKKTTETNNRLCNKK